jgi:hypothetical protein
MWLTLWSRVLGKVDTSSFRQEFSRIFLNPQFHHRIYNSPHQSWTGFIQCTPCILFLQDPFNFHPSIYAQVFQSFSFLQPSPPKSRINFPSIHICHMSRPTNIMFFISNNIPTMTALISIYIHLFGITLPDAFRCFLCTPSSGASTRFHFHGYYDPLHHHVCLCFPGISILSSTMCIPCSIEIPDFKFMFKLRVYDFMGLSVLTKF